MVLTPPRNAWCTRGERRAAISEVQSTKQPHAPQWGKHPYRVGSQKVLLGRSARYGGLLCVCREQVLAASRSDGSVIEPRSQACTGWPRAARKCSSRCVRAAAAGTILANGRGECARQSVAAPPWLKRMRSGSTFWCCYRAVYLEARSLPLDAFSSTEHEVPTGMGDHAPRRAYAVRESVHLLIGQSTTTRSGRSCLHLTDLALAPTFSNKAPLQQQQGNGHHTSCCGSASTHTIAAAH